MLSEQRRTAASILFAENKNLKFLYTLRVSINGNSACLAGCILLDPNVLSSRERSQSLVWYRSTRNLNQLLLLFTMAQSV
jgi:hypothetical protein